LHLTTSEIYPQPHIAHNPPRARDHPTTLFLCCLLEKMLKGERDKIGRDDMVTMTGVSEGDIISNIQQRYTGSIIYVRMLFTVLFC
jgi:hypothetical protein